MMPSLDPGTGTKQDCDRLLLLANTLEPQKGAVLSSRTTSCVCNEENRWFGRSPGVSLLPPRAPSAVFRQSNFLRHMDRFLPLLCVRAHTRVPSAGRTQKRTQISTSSMIRKFTLKLNIRWLIHCFHYILKNLFCAVWPFVCLSLVCFYGHQSHLPVFILTDWRNQILLGFFCKIDFHSVFLAAFSTWIQVCWLCITEFIQTWVHWIP